MARKSSCYVHIFIRLPPEPAAATCLPHAPTTFQGSCFISGIQDHFSHQSFRHPPFLLRLSRQRFFLTRDKPLLHVQSTHPVYSSDLWGRYSAPPSIVIICLQVRGGEHNVETTVFVKSPARYHDSQVIPFISARTTFLPIYVFRVFGMISSYSFPALIISVALRMPLWNTAIALLLYIYTHILKLPRTTCRK